MFNQINNAKFSYTRLEFVFSTKMTGVLCYTYAFPPAKHETAL